MADSYAILPAAVKTSGAMPTRNGVAPPRHAASNLKPDYERNGGADRVTAHSVRPNEEEE